MSDDLVQHAVDLLGSVGPVRARRMFGGWGLFVGTPMIGLIYEGRIFLKTDPESRARFRAAGGQPFVYRKQGKAQETSYFTPPEAALEAPAAMRPWAKLALAAAGRVAAKKPQQKAASQTKKTAKKKAKKKARPRR